MNTCLLALSALLSAGACAQAAQGEVLHLPGGRVAGVTPAAGVTASSLPGAIARVRTPATSSMSGRLTYNGGPVLHASAPYLIFWTPSGQSLPSGTQSLLTRYFTDAAADAGTSSNVYSVARQYTDASGSADYRQSFSAAQVITDTGAYPSRDRANCPAISSGYPTCITDAQLETELQREITALHLPTDGPASSEAVPATAPIYFVVLPADVNVCTAWSSPVSCASPSSNGFCSYHSVFTDTQNQNSVLYATVPTLIIGAGQNPKVCQADGNGAVQEPNGSPADVVLKYVSHEDNEAITDPFLDAWYDPVSGNENGDNCNMYGSASPANSTSPAAFTPVLGGSAGGGTLYNQLISSDRYYVQSEWSNGDSGCEMRSAAATLTPTFTAPAATSAPGTAITFDPSSTVSAAALSSATWSFGDGHGTTFNLGSQALAPVNHTYAADGTYTVTLTLIDAHGNLATSSHVVHVDEPPTASFQVTSGAPGSGQTTALNASASADPDGHITAYAWTFGDGTAGTGVSPSHVYQTAGNYTVTLTVTDSDGDTASTAQTLAVAGPTPSFSASAAVENAPVQFDGTASGDTTGATISSQTWNFGDGSTESGTLLASHTYAHYGNYFVTLTLTDANGDTSSATQQITVADETPTAALAVTTAAPGSGQPATFDASASSDPDGTIVGYAWTFGDATTGTGATVSHVFAAPGTYTVALTVTDSDGDTATVTAPVTVAGPLAQFTAPTPQLEGSTLAFDAGDPGPAAAAPVSYAWTFGDGATASAASATHAYAAAGTYSAILTETDANGNTSTVTHSVTVLDEAPTAAFTVATSLPSTQRPVAFDAGQSSDPDGSVVGYAWNFGDGLYGSGATPTHQFAAAGTYTVTLIVTDSNGQSSTAVSHQVLVYAPPQAAFAISGNGSAEETPLSFDAGASGDIGAGGPITGYAWTFGDGATGSGLTTTHAYGKPGPYPVTLTITNAVGLTTSLTQWVTIGDEPAVASPAVVTYDPVAGQSVAFDGAASADPDGHIVAWDWNFGDGHSASGMRPSHTYVGAGVYTVTLTVIGSGGERGSRPLTVVIGRPAHITRVAARPGGGGPTLVIVVSGPGRLRVGSHSYTVRAAGSTQVRLRFTAAQQRTLAAHHRVRVRASLAFIPNAGYSSGQTVTVTVRQPTRSRHYTVQLHQS